ncbi:MAG: TRAP transporter large permease subunit [Alphaproteobacteria bacterium]|nr:MAG: TRAP transporter large permease subunit [Alphaproteobacteria bacterium]
MDPTLLLFLGMLVSLGFLLVRGYPVAFTLAGVALIFAFLGLALSEGFGITIGTLDFGIISLFTERIYGIMTNEILLAIPLFIAMGVMLEKSRVAEDLLETMAALFGRVRGGLGISVIIVGALMAASTGIVGATVVTMGLLSLPTMLKRGYLPSLAAGSIAASGTLGQIIPPSIVLVMLGDVLSSAYQSAQRDMGIFSPDTITVGDLFAGAFLPGMGLVFLFILYQIGMAIFRPETCPAMPRTGEQKIAGKFLARVITALIIPVALIVAVLGSILTGVATPTEAASLGAVGAFLLAGLKLAPSRWKVITAGALALMVILAGGAGLIDGFSAMVTWPFLIIFGWGFLVSLGAAWKTGVLAEVMTSTLKISTMVFTILLAAALFSLVFRGFGGDSYIEGVLTNLPGGVVGAMILVMVVMFILGFFLDFIEIIFVVVPIVAPPLMVMGVDPLWLGIMIAINLQTSFLTPPFGFALFYLRGVAPKAVLTTDIYKGVIPFILIQIMALILLAIFPEIATWLPGVVFG